MSLLICIECLNIDQWFTLFQFTLIIRKLLLFSINYTKLYFNCVVAVWFLRLDVLLMVPVVGWSAVCDNCGIS